MAGEGRALAGLALQRYPAAVQLDQGLDQGQAQARAAAVAEYYGVEAELEAALDRSIGGAVANGLITQAEAEAVKP